MFTKGGEKLDPCSHLGVDGKTNVSWGGGAGVGVRAQVKGLAFCKRRDISSKDILVERDINILSLGSVH